MGWLTILLIIICFLLILLIIILYYIQFPIHLQYNLITIDNLQTADQQYAQKPRVCTKNRVVITLTTTPDRLPHLYVTLYSLLRQNVRVDDIYINIPYVSRRGVKYIIPSWLSSLSSITIRRVDNDIGPITKLLPTWSTEGDDSLIIVVDDDLTYGTRLVQTLVQQYNLHSCAITSVGGKLNESMTTRFFSHVKSGRYVHVLTGYSGFLIQKKMLSDSVRNYEIGPKESISVDDNWISGWLGINRVPVRSIGMSYGCHAWASLKDWSTPSLSLGVNADNNNVQVVDSWFEQLGAYEPIVE